MTAPKVDSNHFAYYTDAATCTVKASAGTLVRVIMTDGGATTGLITLKDNATVIAHFQAGTLDGSYEIGVHFDTSLVCVVGNAADDVTVVYR
jgi:hypothetical protein